MEGWASESSRHYHTVCDTSDRVGTLGDSVVPNTIMTKESNLLDLAILVHLTGQDGRPSRRPSGRVPEWLRRGAHPHGAARAGRNHQQAEHGFQRGGERVVSVLC